MSRQPGETPMGNPPSERPGMPAGMKVTDVERTTVERPITEEEMRAMMRREPMAYRTNWRPITGGVLAMIAGAWNLFVGIGVVASQTFLTNFLTNYNFGKFGGVANITTALGIVMIVLGAISILGGISAVFKRMYWLSILGAVVAMFPNPLIFPFFVGLFSTVFVAQSRHDFMS